jgi:glycosyltransferase involved in cell wall biosynthesis
MHRNLLSGKVEFESPWDQELLHERISNLLSHHGERVAYLYGTPDTSTFRYRVFNILEAVSAVPDCPIGVGWFAVSEVDELRAILPRLSTLVLARVRYSRAVSDLIAAARCFGVRVLFDCDDLVFDVRYGQLVSVNNDQPFDLEAHLDVWYAYVGRLNATALQCDGGIATNPFLAEKMQRVCKGQAAIIPNFLNRRQEEVSRRLLEAKVARGFQGDGRVTIGYFSGSPTHNKDFRVALDALVRLMKEDANVDVRIVGFMEGHSELAFFGDRVETIPLQDWMNLQVKIAEVDINIAPLQLNDFTHCKSELKYFEAAAVGTYSVLSRSHTLEKAVLSADDAAVIENWQWFDGLKAAVARVRNTEAYAIQAQRTANCVYSRYGWDRNTEAILAALRKPPGWQGAA